MTDARLTAVKLLDRTFLKKGFSNIVLDTALKNSEFEVQDKKFCTVLYYGVLERKITLDCIISEYCNKMKKIPETVLNIMRISIYQLVYMDSVPERAVVNEAVKLAGKLGYSGFRGLLNAVLRNFIRNGKSFELPKDNYQMFSVKYSAPLWLVEMLINQYNNNFAEMFLESSLKKPPLTVRLNNLKADEKILSENTGKLEFIKNNNVKGCYEVSGGDISSVTAFEKGMFHVQDTASQLCCMALNPQKNDIVVDICSAPGGKAFTMAELMENTGKIYAFDLYKNRVKLIEKGAERLGISNITANTGDALVFNENIPKADKVLCDVVCSGLGVIRRKPEIKYKNPDEFENLPQIQYKMLENASKYLKEGGELVYSTCTVNKKENDEIIEKFLENHSEFQPCNLGEPFDNGFKIQLSPEYMNCDGFFISKIKRIK